MSNPDQVKHLATISGLAAGLQKQSLSDIQMDLLEVAVHLMTNIAVQSTLHGKTAMTPAEPAAPVVFEPGEPAIQTIPADRLQHEHKQRTTIINKRVSDDSDGGYLYQTSHTGRGVWISAAMLSKVK